jgi:hypothetical protein
MLQHILYAFFRLIYAKTLSAAQREKRLRDGKEVAIVPVYDCNKGGLRYYSCYMYGDRKQKDKSLYFCIGGGGGGGGGGW